MLEIVDEKELGRRIKAARGAQGLTMQQLAALAQVPAGSLPHWEEATRAPRAVAIASVGLALKLTPNQLLLKDNAAARHLNEQANAHLQHLADLFAELREHWPAAADPPEAIVARFLEDFCAPYRLSRPAGTTIRRPEPGVTTLEPPPKRKRGAPARKGYGPGAASGGVAEAPAAYGARTARVRRQK